MRAAAAALALLVAAPAFAEDAKPCSKIGWPLGREFAAIAAITGDTASGTVATAAPPLAVRLKLAKGLALPGPSDKPTDSALFAGYLALNAPAAGVYLVSLSSEAWIDVVQDGHTIAPDLHAGDPNCPGLRKSVRFELTNKPATIQVSNEAEDHITLVVTSWYVKRKL